MEAIMANPTHETVIRFGPILKDPHVYQINIIRYESIYVKQVLIFLFKITYFLLKT